MQYNILYIGCLKIISGQNPNIEYRNTKQTRISNDPITETNTFHIRLAVHSLSEVRCFYYENIIIFVIVSHFVLRISDFYQRNACLSST
jgi:hypothetical protein